MLDRCGRMVGWVVISKTGYFRPVDALLASVDAVLVAIDPTRAGAGAADLRDRLRGQIKPDEATLDVA